MIDRSKEKRHAINPWFLVGLGIVFLLGLLILLTRTGGPGVLRLLTSPEKRSTHLLVFPMPEENVPSTPPTQSRHGGRQGSLGLRRSTGSPSQSGEAEPPIGPLAQTASGRWLRSTSAPTKLSVQKRASAQRAAQEMDRRLEELWARLGLAAVHLEGIGLVMRDWDGEPWEIRALEVRVPDGIALDQAAKGLETLGEEGEPEVQLVWAVEGEGFRRADLWVEGFFTHRIWLRETPQLMPPPLLRPQLAVIVDDLGNAYEPVRPLLEEDLPLTFAILPLRPFSQRIAEEAAGRGMEVMMHLPMEPWDYPEKNPGPGALMVTMRDMDLRKILLDNLKDLPQVRGVNNHMGSRFTEERQPMKSVLEILAARDLYFVDSLTTPRSVGFRLAKHMGVRAYRRNVFLDVFPGEEGIRMQFRELLRVAQLQGYAVGICHPYPATVKILPDLLREAEGGGFQLVTVSQLQAPGVEPILAGMKKKGRP